MKIRKELIESLKKEREKIDKQRENELSLFKDCIDFKEIYRTIEGELKESYLINHGRMRCDINLYKFMPVEFDFEIWGEKELEYNVRDIIVDNLTDKDYSCSVSDMMLTIT